jgi:hypothetical protein
MQVTDMRQCKSIFGRVQLDPPGAGAGLGINPKQYPGVRWVTVSVPDGAKVLGVGVQAGIVDAYLVVPAQSQSDHRITFVLCDRWAVAPVDGKRGYVGTVVREVDIMHVYVEPDDSGGLTAC